MHEIEPYAIVEFENDRDAYQVKLSMLLEKVKPFELADLKTAIVSLDDLETLKEVCAEAEISKGISTNYSHLPFPRHDRECESSYSVYIECESASDHNMIHAMWLDCDQAQEDLEDDLDWFLSWSPVRAIEACESWNITDSNGFEDIDLDDFKSAKDLSVLAYGFQYNDCGALAAFIKESGYKDGQEAIDDFDSYYYGTYSNEADFAKEWAINSGYLEEIGEYNPLRDCIDWEKVAEFLECDGYWLIWDDCETVYVFSSH